MREYKDPNNKFKVIIEDTFQQRCELRDLYDAFIATHSNCGNEELILKLKANKQISSKIQEIMKSCSLVMLNKGAEGDAKVPLTIENVKASLINENLYFRLICILAVDYVSFFFTDGDE